MSQTIDTGTDELLCHIDERVATITLNRPEKRNALSDNLTPALRQVLFDLDTRQDVGCLVITGAKPCSSSSPSTLHQNQHHPINTCVAVVADGFLLGWLMSLFPD